MFLIDFFHFLCYNRGRRSVSGLNEKKKLLMKAAIVAALCIAAVILTIIYIVPLSQALMSEAGRQSLCEKVQSYGVFAPLVFILIMAAQIVVSLLMLLVLPLTVRRLQDGGHSKWWVVVAWVASTVSNIYMAVSPAMDALTSVNPDPEAALGLFTDPVIIVCSLVSAVAGIATFVFCLMDGKPEANQYGESPKYYTPY